MNKTLGTYITLNGICKILNTKNAEHKLKGAENKYLLNCDGRRSFFERKRSITLKLRNNVSIATFHLTTYGFKFLSF